MRATMAARTADQAGLAVSWADRYERLRARGGRLDQRVHDAEGLVLFMREGSVSWMQALGVRHPAAGARPASAAGDLAGEAGTADLTEALAAMVWSAAEMLP